MRRKDIQPNEVKTITIANFQAFGHRCEDLFYNQTEQEVKETIMNICDTAIIYSIIIFETNLQTNSIITKPFEIEKRLDPVTKKNIRD